MSDWFCVFFFMQKTAYELRISDWSSDVCSSDLEELRRPVRGPATLAAIREVRPGDRQRRERRLERDQRGMVGAGARSGEQEHGSDGGLLLLASGRASHAAIPTRP